MYVRIVLMLALLALLVATSDAGLLRHKVSEVVVNDLQDNKTLTLHCWKRKGRDLGVKALRPHETFEWTFRPNIWGTTKYYCSFQWKGVLVNWFDLYIRKRDHEKCRECTWSVREVHICRYDSKANNYNKCFPWKKE